MLAIAVFLLGLLAILESQGPVNSTLELILGIVVIVLAFLSFVPGYFNFPVVRRPPQ